MIIELGKYNEIGELLIENRTTGSQGHVCYWDGGQKVSVTRVAVHMGLKEMGMRTGNIGAYNWPLGWEREQVYVGPLWSNQRSISMQ